MAAHSWAVLYTLERLREMQFPGGSRREFEVEYLDELELRGLIEPNNRGGVRVSEAGYEALEVAREAAAAALMAIPIRA